jgi:glucokinase
MLLAGDIGGTKTRLIIFSPEAGPRAPVAEKIYPSGNYSSLEAVVTEFLAETEVQIDQTSFGVAGPVIGGQATITNLPWVMNEAQLAEALEVPSVHLLNDLKAIAYAVPSLEPQDLQTLYQGNPVQDGTIAVIAPGTGLGEAYLVWDGTRYRAYPSEGGHTDFAPTNTLQIDMLLYLQERLGHVSYERVCSGRGMPNIYAFLRDSGYAEEPAWLAEQLASTADPTPIIVTCALDKDKPCELCVATLNTFVSILGAETGNLALKVLASGGVYLGGGIPHRILPALEKGQFLAAYRQKGRFASFLNDVPVYAILNPNVALLGAAHYGLDLYGAN